jgi:transposase
MIKFFEKLPPVTVALEACGASHHWARLLSSFGHEVKLIAPQLAKPYIKRGKNDAADAEACSVNCGHLGYKVASSRILAGTRLSADLRDRRFSTTGNNHASHSQ